MNESRTMHDWNRFISQFSECFFFCSVFVLLWIFSALWEFMTAPNECLQRRVYNVTAMSFTPEELVDKLYKYVPELRVTYKPDSRQNIGNNEEETRKFFFFLILMKIICI